MRHSNATADALAFVAEIIAKLDVNDGNDQDLDEAAVTEISTLLKDLGKDLSLDLYAKLGKAEMMARKAKGKDAGSITGSVTDGTDDLEHSTGKAHPQKRKSHRPNLEDVREDEEGMSEGHIVKRVQTRKSGEIMEEDDDHDADDLYHDH